jgi:tetratricopeptide (TPR) repeat protein
VHMDPGAAVPLLEDILMTLAGARSAAPDKRQALELDVRLRLTEALSQSGDLEGALDAAEFALDRTGDARARFALAQARYAFGDVEGASEALSEFLREEGARADAWHLEGRVALSLDDESRAAHAFARAAALEPDAYPVPPRLPPERFEARMRAAMRALPEPLARYAAAMEVEFAAMPDLAALRAVDPPLPPSTPLFLEGDRPEGDPFSRLPERLVIFQRNIEVLAASEGELEEVLLSALTQAFTLFLDPPTAG